MAIIPPGVLSALPVTVPVSVPAAPVSDAARWPSERAWDWYRGRPWPCGFNYVPGHAISYTEMFMGYNFDPARMDGELALARDAGFNCTRVVLPFVVWEHEPTAFQERLATLLQGCDKHGLQVMPALFDDCVFGPITDPDYGPQPELVPGWYANGWTPSPGRAIAGDPAQWPRLEQYVTDLLGTFQDDPRILLWDLYNEPASADPGPGSVNSVALVDQVFDWARAVNPSQPLTVDTFGSAQLKQLALERSDIITFHNYTGPQQLEAEITSLKQSGRPLICTEWLNRNAGSTVAACLPLFVAEDVGCLHWGLVNGRTQTDLNWGHRPGQPAPEQWQHDLFHADLTPYDPHEIDLFQRFIHVAARLRDESGRCKAGPAVVAAAGR